MEIKTVDYAYRKAKKMCRARQYPGIDSHLAAQGLQTILDGWKLSPTIPIEEYAFEGLSRECKTICFVANCPYYNLARSSSILRRNGYQTILLTLTSLTERYQQDYFDVVKDFSGNFLQLLTVLDTLSIDLVYVQGWHHNYHIPALTQFFLTNTPVLCEFQDIVSFFLSKNDYLGIWGLKAAAVELDFWSERYVLDCSKGCTFPYDEQTEEILRSRYDNKNSVMSLPACPTKSFFAPERTTEPDQPPGLVFVGGIPATNYPDLVFSDAKMLNVLPIILKQGFDLDLYNNPILPDEMEIYYPEHLALTWEYSNYRFFKGLSPSELKSIAHKYEYGLMLYNFREVVVLDDHLGHVLPSKFYTYLEMGLPVLVSEELRAVADLVEKYGLGIVCSYGDIKNLNDLLAMADWKILHANVVEYRAQCGVEHVAPRLLTFIDELICRVGG